MKLSLTLLAIFGLVAFVGAAPFEEEPEIPEELKTKDEDIPEVENEDELMNVPEEEESEADSLMPNDEDEMEDPKKKKGNPHRLPKKTCRVDLVRHRQNVYRCIHCCHVRCGHWWYHSHKHGHYIFWCRARGGFCWKACKKVTKPRPTPGSTPRPAPTTEPKSATTEERR